MKKTKLTSQEYNRKLEHQIYLAQEHPAKIYDLTDCNINQIPKGVFTYCKVLRKYSLNLGENNLNSLESGGNLEDLSYLGALILSKNSFKFLSSDFCKLINLKKLSLDFNKFQKFPVVVIQLPNLKILNLAGNSIKIIPKEVAHFKSLESFNLLNNPLTNIAPEVCQISTLKMFHVSLENVKNIPSDIIEKGIEAVWKYFCIVKNIPAKRINEFEFGDQKNSETKHICHTQNLDLRYTKIGDEIEREIMEHEQNVSLVENEDRRRSMEEIKRKIQIEDDIICDILSKKQHENDRLMNAIKYEEINTNELINKIFEFNNKAKKKEELRNKIEERNKSFGDISFILTNESKNEILHSMMQLLRSASGTGKNRSDFIKDFDDELLLNKISQNLNLDQDEEQKLAYKQLQFEKDPQLSRLRDGMEIIEKKLQQLSVEDMIEGSLVRDYNRNDRAHLVNVLKELGFEKENREKILNYKIDQMEYSRSYNQKDFWIAQYQTLLDDKAKSDFEVRELLKMASMEEWIPVFLKNNFTIDMMLDLNKDDLDQLQIKPESVKSKFLSFINEWKFNPIKSEKCTSPSAPSINLSECVEINSPQSVIPSAPALEIPSIHDKNHSYKAPENTVILARKEAECCICLTLEARILLLNCGHVCCCRPCSLSVKECPLCRQVIVQKVNLEFSI